MDYDGVDLFQTKLPPNYNPKMENLGIESISPYVDNNPFKEDYDFVVLLEQPYDQYQFALDSTIKETLITEGWDNPKILYLYNCKRTFSFEDFQKNKTKEKEFFDNQHIDYAKYIKPYSYVLVIGESLRSIARDDISVSDFYDVVFNKTYFFFPEIKSYMFPVTRLNTFFSKPPSYITNPLERRYSKFKRPKDNWEYAFLKKQIREMAKRPAFQRNKTTKIVNVKDIDSFYEEHKDKKRVSLDTETDSLDFMEAKIGCVSLAFDSSVGYVIDWSLLDPVEFGAFVKDKEQIYQNGKYDIKVLRRNGVPHECLRLDSDTLYLAHLANEMSSNSLKTFTWVYTDFGGYDKELDDYKKKYKPDNYLCIPNHILYPYAGKDALATYISHDRLLSHIREIDSKFPLASGRWSLEKFYTDIMLPTSRSFLEMEWEGIYVNYEVMLKERDKLFEEVKEQKLKVYEAFGIKDNDIRPNLDSPDSMGKFIESQFVIDPSTGAKIKKYAEYGRSKRGLYLAGKTQIAIWIQDGHKEFESFKEYKKLQAYLRTSVGRGKSKGYINYVKKHPDGSYRIHADFYAHLAKTMRHRSANPNMQNIAKHAADAKRIKQFYIPPSSDYKIMEMDAAGFQLRIGASMSGDPKMLRVFTELGGDLHSMTAVTVFHRDMTIEEFIKRKKEPEFDLSRFKSKGINFGFLFGQTGRAFASKVLMKEWSYQDIKKYLRTNSSARAALNKFKKKELDVEEKELEYWAVGFDIRTKFFSEYSVLHEWVEAMPKFAEDHGYVRSDFGPIRRLPELLHFGEEGKQNNKRHYSNLRNIALNSPVQTFESVRISVTINKLRQYIIEHSLKSRVFMTIHDSLLVYLHKDEERIIPAKAKEFFEEMIPENNGVPMLLEGQISDYYGKGEIWGEGVEI